MASSKWGGDIPLYRRGDRGDGTAIAHVLSESELRRLGRVVGDTVQIERQIDEIDRRLHRLDTSDRVDLREAGDRTYVIDDQPDSFRSPRSSGDDAITIDQGGDGLRLMAHTIDVPALLDTGSPLDRRAAALGKTIYLPDDRELLFPEVLYRDHFSFPARAERPANTVEFRFDADADLDDVSLYRSVVRPDRRLSYDAADRLLRTPASEASDRTERRAIRDMEALKVAAMSLVDHQSQDPGSRWGADEAVEIVEGAVNRYATEALRESGRGVYRNQGYAIGDWAADAERYLRAAGHDVADGRLASADDPVRELSMLYRETESDVIGEIYREARRWAEDDRDRDLLSPRRSFPPHRYGPVPFGHEALDAGAYARFTNPRSNYGDIVNWRSVLGEPDVAPIGIDAVAENLGGYAD